MKTGIQGRWKIAGILFLSIFIVTGAAQDRRPSAPRQILLAWRDDPRTTMTITWRTDRKGESSVAWYSSRTDADLSAYSRQEAETFTFKGTSAWLHTVDLRDLVPGETYRVVLETDGELGEPFSFRTAPDRSTDITFVMGADAQHLRTQMHVIREVIGRAAREDPDFFVYSGDFVNAELSEYEWDLFFDLAHELLVTGEGRRIPIVPAIGNHEVVAGYGGNRELAPYYYMRIPLPEPKNYHALRYGPDLLVLSLDSNHSAPVEGAQTGWLAETLERHKDAPWKIAHYHDGAWWGKESMYVKMRAFWVPLFEAYGLALVHNGHSHSYKRTSPLYGIGAWSETLDAIVEEAIGRANRDYDPSKKYAPPLQKNLMKLSRGDWKSTGFPSMEAGLREMVYMLSLYAIQTGGATKGKVYDQIGTTQLFADYWASFFSQEGSGRLVDASRGVVYLTGGGLGAEMDPKSAQAPGWWIEHSASEYHYRKVTLDVSTNELRIEPAFYDPSDGSWVKRDATTIRR